MDSQFIQLSIRIAEAYTGDDNFLRWLLDHSPVGITVTDTRGSPSYMNPQARKILRWEHPSPSMTTASALAWYQNFGCFDPKDPGKAVPVNELPGVVAFTQNRPAERHLIVRTEGMRETGEYEQGVLVWLQSVPYHDAKNQVVGVVSFLHNAAPVCGQCPMRLIYTDAQLPAVLPGENPLVDVAETDFATLAAAPSDMPEVSRLRAVVTSLRGYRPTAKIRAIEDELAKVQAVLASVR